MSEIVDLHQFTLVGLSYRCHQETQNFYQGKDSDPRYGFELFRRSLETPANPQSQLAWEFIYKNYESLALDWESRHPLFHLAGGQKGDFTTIAFTKMWNYFANGPGEFHMFPNLSTLLKFLQICIHNEITEHYRKYHARIEPDDEVGGNPVETVHYDSDHHQRLEIEEFWKMVYDKTNTDKEKILIYAHFELLLPPRKIPDIFPIFKDEAEVKRVRDTLLKRLRRNQMLKKYLRLYLHD